MPAPTAECEWLDLLVGGLAVRQPVVPDETAEQVPAFDLIEIDGEDSSAAAPAGSKGEARQGPSERP